MIVGLDGRPLNKFDIAVQASLLPYMLSLVIASLEKTGIVVSEEVKVLINIVSAVAFKDFGTIDVRIAGKRVTKDGYEALHRSGVGELSTLFGGLGQLIVKLHSEGFSVDSDTYMVGVLISNEMLEHANAYGGINPVRNARDKIHNELRAMNYFV